MKPKTWPNTEERATIVTLAANGASQSKIAQTIGRSRGLVKHILADPEVQKTVADEKQELAVLYRSKARACVEAIDTDKIKKSSALQLATTAGICTDKALILTGDVPPIRVEILLEAVQAVRDKRAAEDTRHLAEYRATHELPAPGTGQAQ